VRDLLITGTGTSASITIRTNRPAMSLSQLHTLEVRSAPSFRPPALTARSDVGHECIALRRGRCKRKRRTTKLRIRAWPRSSNICWPNGMPKSPWRRSCSRRGSPRAQSHDAWLRFFASRCSRRPGASPRPHPKQAVHLPTVLSQEKVGRGPDLYPPQLQFPPANSALYRERQSLSEGSQNPSHSDRLRLYGTSLQVADERPLSRVFG